MDKKSVLALILIAVIILLLPYYQKIIMGDQEIISEPMTKVVDEKVKKDSVITPPAIKNKEKKASIEETISENTQETSFDVEKIVVQDSVERKIVVENSLMKAVLSNKGGGSLQSFILKKYNYHDSIEVNLIDKRLKNDLSLKFRDLSGDFVNTADFLFTSNQNTTQKIIKDNETFSIEYSLKIKDSEIKKTYTFYPDAYHFDVKVYFSNPDKLLLNKEYSFGWKNGLPSTEVNEQEDFSYSRAYAYMADDLENFEVTDEGESESAQISGTADWIAVRLKYFLIAIANDNKKNIESVYFKGLGVKKGEYIQRIYDAEFNADYKNKSETFHIYLGPLDYDILKGYKNNLEELVMNNGWYERTFRIFSLLVLKILQFLHQFIPNYGVVIIIFSILIKLVLTPFTKKSYKSMHEMKVIQPLVAEIKEKYKGDAQRINKETMKLYKEYGVNPMGGCLPMLLQMPLLMSLYIVFRSTIQLRGAMFIPGWIPDLSLPDTIFILPFHIPMYGNQFNILPILMAVTMIFQSGMTITDPKQKSMKYIMPVFMLLIFNRLSSGLNLYYTLFNVLTMVQQKFIKTEPHPVKKGKQVPPKKIQNYKKKKK
jgi:YidC/Oxa1 family membrane protein insertase